MLSKKINPKLRNSKNKARVIGIAGGAGSGKTTLARIFAGFGARVVDADRLGHRLLWRRGPAYRKVVKNFGRGILGRQGAINRKKLGRLVFGDPAKMKTLNRIVHPILKKELLARMENLRSSRKPVVVDAALLVSWGLQGQVDRLVAVTAPDRVRLKRLIAKGLEPQRAADIIRSQGTQEAIIRAADLVVKNHGSLARLRRQAREAWHKLVEA